jgi:hypothetical protein
MYCLVDYRNRPQFGYTFYSSAKAREYIRKIKNNPLGVTVIYRDGRREYFEHGLPEDFRRSQNKTWKIKRGFHIRYSLRKLSTLDSARFSTNSKKSTFSQKSWRLFDSWPIFMLGNKKFYACLFTLTIIFSFSAYFFQKNYGAAVSLGTNSVADSGKVLGASFAKVLGSEQANNEPALKLADENVIINLLGKIKEEKEGEFEKEIIAYIKSTPMESMAPYIAKQPRTVAAFIVGIAMKESKFGFYAPHDSDGNDCHNYWGYRGPENTTASGYSCFANPEQAIQAVGKRIAKLVDQGASNPSEMVVWKCGASCSWDNPEDVRKWISDVGINFYKINS